MLRFKLYLFIYLFVFVFSNDTKGENKVNEKSNNHHLDKNFVIIEGFHYHQDLTNQSFWNTENIKNITQKLGFQEKENLTLQEFKNILYELTGFNQTNIFSIPEYMHKILDIYVFDFPEKINMTEISNYLNVNKFFNIIKENYNDRNELTNYDQLMRVFNKGWSNVSDLFKYIILRNQFCCDEGIFNRIIEKLSFKYNDKLGKKDVEKILCNLFIEDKFVSIIYPKSVKDVLNKILETIPEHITVNELKKYISYDKLMPIIKNIALIHYGEDHLKKYEDDYEKTNMTYIISRVFNFTKKHPEDL